MHKDRVYTCNFKIHCDINWVQQLFTTPITSFWAFRASSHDITTIKKVIKIFLLVCKRPVSQYCSILHVHNYGRINIKMHHYSTISLTKTMGHSSKHCFRYLQQYKTICYLYNLHTQNTSRPVIKISNDHFLYSVVKPHFTVISSLNTYCIQSNCY